MVALGCKTRKRKKMIWFVWVVGLLGQKKKIRMLGKEKET